MPLDKDGYWVPDEELEADIAEAPEEESWVRKIMPQSVEYGFSQSIPGIMTKFDPPENYEPAENFGLKRLVEQFSTIVPEIPAYEVYGHPGRIAGAAAGTAIGGPIGGAIGGAVGAGVSGFMGAEATRSFLSGWLRDNPNGTIQDGLRAMVDDKMHILKSGVIGAATGAGGLAGRAGGEAIGKAVSPSTQLAGKVIGRTSKTPSNVLKPTPVQLKKTFGQTVGTESGAIAGGTAGLLSGETVTTGELPTVDEIASAVILVGGLHASGAVISKIKADMSKPIEAERYRKLLDEADRLLKLDIISEEDLLALARESGQPEARTREALDVLKVLRENEAKRNEGVAKERINKEPQESLKEVADSPASGDRNMFTSANSPSNRKTPLVERFNELARLQSKLEAAAEQGRITPEGQGGRVRKQLDYWLTHYDRLVSDGDLLWTEHNRLTAELSEVLGSKTPSKVKEISLSKKLLKIEKQLAIMDDLPLELAVKFNNSISGKRHRELKELQYQLQVEIDPAKIESVKSKLNKLMENKEIDAKIGQRRRSILVEAERTGVESPRLSKMSTDPEFQAAAKRLVEIFPEIRVDKVIDFYTLDNGKTLDGLLTTRYTADKTKILEGLIQVAANYKPTEGVLEFGRYATQTLGHEGAHHLFNLLGNSHPLVAEAVRVTRNKYGKHLSFEDAEEYFVDLVGDYYADKIYSKGLKSNIEHILKGFYEWILGVFRPNSGELLASVRTFQRMLETGKIKNPQRQVESGLIGEVRDVHDVIDFKDNLANQPGRLTHKFKQAKDDVRKLDRIAKWLNVEYPWKKLDNKMYPGASEVGTQIKIAPSKSSYWQQNALDVIIDLAKMSKGDQVTMLNAVLYYETPRLMKSLSKEDLSMYKPMVKKIGEFFDIAKTEYQKRGVLSAGGQVENKLRKLTEKLTDNLDPKAEKEIMQQIQFLIDGNYVHLPTMVMLSKMTATNKTEVRRALRLYAQKQRRTLKLSELLKLQDEQGNYLIELGRDFFVEDIFTSYGQRIGRDFSNLDIVNAAKKAKLAYEPTKGKKKPEGSESFVDSPARAGIFKGTKLHPELADWVEWYTRKQSLSWVHKPFIAAKMLAFINPLFLPGYDIVQGMMVGTINPLRPLRTMSALSKAFKSHTTHDFEYSMFMQHGAPSQPIHEPYMSYMQTARRSAKGGTVGDTIGAYIKDIMQTAPNLPKMGWATTKAMYEASWNVAWNLDRFIRLWSYHYLRNKGLSYREAAQAAAKIHGDYASVPEASRRAMNYLFFTPTFKIAMGGLYLDMAKNAAKVATGKAKTPYEGAMGYGFVRWGAFLIGFDAVMTQMLGFDRDKFGLGYTKSVDTPQGPQEVVVNWPNPANLFIKYIYRAIGVLQPERINSPLHFFNSMKWELHPIWRVGMSLLNNQNDQGERIVSEFDNPGVKLSKMLVYSTKSIVRAFSGMDTNEYTKLAHEKLKEESGQVFMLAVRSFGYPYLRLDKQTRKAIALRRLKGEYEKEIYELTRHAARVNKPIDEQRVEMIAKNFVKRIEELTSDEAKRVEQFEQSSQP